MDPQRFYGKKRPAFSIPESSEDEKASDDETYRNPGPEIFIPESSDDEIASDDDRGNVGEFEEIYLDDDALDNDCDEYIPYETEEEDISSKPSTSKQRTGNKRKKVKCVWSDESMAYDESHIAFLGCQDLPNEIMKLEAPMDFFKFLFPSSAINLIVRESNLYADQITESNHNEVTEEDIRKFLGIIIYMSVVHLPTTRHYWKEGTYIEKVASAMTCNKFEEVKRFLHFFNKNDELESGDPNFDRLQKIRPFLNILRERLLQVPKEEYLAIDEQMIPTKARTSGMRRYNAKKPHKWGYLNYVLSGASGFSYDFEVDTGKHPDPPENCPDLGIPGNIVQRLLNTVPQNLNYKIFVDNWYTSLPLMANLHKKGLLPLGTIQLNRAPNINIEKKTIMKEERGYCAEKSTIYEDVKLTVTTWVDNKPVSLCSSYVGKEPMAMVKRFLKKKRAKIDIPCPKAITIYNKYMGGVDLLDSMLGFYRIKIRSKKWNHRLFFHFIDLVCVNSWLLWRRRTKQKGEDMYIPLLDFKLMVAEILMQEDARVFTPTRRGRPQNANIENIKKDKKRRRIELPPVEVAEDGFNHWPEWNTDRQRCKMVGCGQKTQVMCTKCKCYLCLNKDRNCFKKFHMSHD
ncbi:unnamed protein product [Parnassius mnemosyne]|uniref:PiggyBac transposable element-derived protein domain-containing protein n=1 Tax=Parnassius mnemosyne TaxID=213953 RepID=A0AAV1KZ68_9NEOP